MAVREQLRGVAPQISAAVPTWMLVLGAALPITLSVTEDLGLSAAETASWVMAFFGVSAVLGIVLSWRFKQPMIFTGHILALIMFGSIGDEFSFPELVGASMVAGAAVALLGVTGVTGRITTLIPAPVVMALIGGTVLPFVSDMFTSLGAEPVIVGSTLVAYLASERLLGTRVPPVVTALAVGVIVAGVTGRFGESLPSPALPEPLLIPPQFSIESIVATLPVLLVMVVLQGNVPSVIFLREQGYEPPERAINAYCGSASVVGSLLGPMAVTVPVPPLAIIGGPGAGPLELRYRAGIASSIAPLIVALGATTAAPLGTFVPRELIVAVAGLALINVLLSSIQDLVRGPLRLGPVIAFAVVLSDVSLLGLGPFFWALAAGVTFSLILERDGWALSRSGA